MYVNWTDGTATAAASIFAAEHLDEDSKRPAKEARREVGRSCLDAESPAACSEIVVLRIEARETHDEIDDLHRIKAHVSPDQCQLETHADLGLAIVRPHASFDGGIHNTDLGT